MESQPASESLGDLLRPHTIVVQSFFSLLLTFQS